MKYLCTLVTVCSFAILAFGLWIPFKAVVAQQLLELAWAESQARQQQVRPWPWADTWPVARLTLQQGEDNSGRSLIVLDGAHGESLAFGPGQVLGSGDSQGPVIIAGHRDTHFKSLQTLEAGHDLRLQGRDGQWQSYRVIDTRVVDSRHQQINTALLPPDTLLLVTCYPFDGLQANGPLRYVVEAKATPSELVSAVVQR